MTNYYEYRTPDTHKRLTVTGVIASAAIVIGSFLPWANVTGLIPASINGTAGDGMFTLAIGTVLALIALTQWSRQQWQKAAAIITVLIAFIALVIAVVDLIEVSVLAEDTGSYVSVSPGIGLYIVLVASAVVGAVGLGGILKAD